ncbi:hypothetical protein DRQ33_03095 [bacterium]|nr:MAG: hypothetical protein DRQ33_03095 [bacterium]
MDSGLFHIFFRNPHRFSLILALIIGALGAYWVYRRTNPAIKSVLRWILTILRFIAIAAIVFMLADPVFLAFNKRKIIPSVVALIDNTESITIQDRWGDRTKKIANFLKSDVWSKIEDKYTIYAFGFSDSIFPLGKLDFSGNVTGIGEVLSAVRDTAQYLEVGAVLLVSDGQSNIGVDPISVSATLPFPVHSVGVGDPEPVPDVSVAQVLSNPIAYTEESTPIVAHIRAWRLDGVKTNVSLWKENNKIGEQNVQLPASGQSVPVKFEVTPKEPGLQYYTVRIPQLSGEISVSNNSRSVPLKVLPARKRILLACDHPSFELAFLRRTLDRDEHLETSLFIQRGGGNVPFRKFPDDTAKLGEYDAIIFIHSTPILTMRVAEALVDYVKSGGSVFLMLDDSIPRFDAIKKLNEILPVHIKSSFVTEQFVPVLSGDGFSHPVMQIAQTGENISDQLSAMPPFIGYVLSEPSDWGSILMVHPETNNPILSVGEIGYGRSAVLCASPIWKWGFLPVGFGRKTNLYTNLVNNLAQYLVAKEKISRFVLKPGKQVYRSGEPIIISASLRDLSNKPISGATIQLTLTRQNGDSAESFTMEMSEVENGVYELQLPSLEQGKYNIHGIAMDSGEKISESRTSFMVEEFQIEYAQTNQDRATLQAISELSGGIYVPIDSVEKLIPNIHIKPRMQSWTTEKELWNSLWLLIIVVVSLSVEWILRKRANLM